MFFSLDQVTKVWIFLIDFSSGISGGGMVGMKVIGFEHLAAGSGQLSGGTVPDQWKWLGP